MSVVLVGRPFCGRTPNVAPRVSLTAIADSSSSDSSSSSSIGYRTLAKAKR